MEAAGLAVGVVGVAGIFSTLLHAAGKVQDYRAYDADSRVLNSHFNSILCRLKRWGDAVGINSSHGASSSAGQSRSHASREVVLEVKDLLIVAAEALNARESNTHARDPGDHSTSSTSRRQKFGWSLRGRLDFKDKVQLFAFTVEELHKLVPIPNNEPSEGEQMIIQKLEESSQELENLKILLDNIKAERPVRKEEVRSLVRSWLYGQAPSNGNFNKYDECLKEKLKGTCDWILKDPTVVEWLQSSRGMLWINGHAGFGKTILCAHITHHIRNTLGLPAVFFFLSAQAGGREDPYAILSSWVAQLTNDDDAAIELAWEHWVSSEASTTATHAELVKVLKEILLIKPNAILILDGLDECSVPYEGPNSVASIIQDLRASTAAGTRIIITSRDTVAIRRAVMDQVEDFHSATEFVLTTEHLRHDNLVVAQDMINQKYPGVSKSKEVKRHLSEKLAEKCAGQMQWLRLQKAPLRQAKNQIQVENMIDKTPVEISDCYTKIWNSISTQPNKREIIALLRWVAFAKRPLTMGELSEAVLIDEESQIFLIEDLPEEEINGKFLESMHPDLGQLLKATKDLEEPPSEWTVTFNHFTVNEFLIRYLPLVHDEREDSTHNECSASSPPSVERLHNLSLARLCLLYLQQPLVFGALARPSEADTVSFQGHLRSYATHGWYQHIGPEATDLNRKTNAMVVEFMSPLNAAWKSWTLSFCDALVHTSTIANSWVGPQGRSFGDPPEVYAPYLLSSRLAPHIWRGRKDLHSKDGMHSNYEAGPLHYSVLLRLTMPLVDQARAKGPAYQHSISGFSALHFAAEWPHLPSVRILLDEGTHCDLLSDKGTPLHVASERGNFEVVKLLLEREADANLLDTSFRPPLCLAARNGHVDAVKELTNHQRTIVDPHEYHEATREEAFEPDWRIDQLDEAKHGQIVRAIMPGLVKGDISLSQVSIFEAAETGNLLLVNMLLRRGVSLQGVGEYDGQTPLHLAAGCGQHQILKALLDDDRCSQLINNIDDKGQTPLLVACRSSEISCAKVLIKKGARRDIADQNGSLPIHMIELQRGGMIYNFVEALREHGGGLYGINAYDSRGYTPLQALALVLRHPDGRKGSIGEATKLLLLAGAELDMQSPTGRTILHVAAANGTGTMIKGILSYCSAYRSKAYMTGLLNRGDFCGRTPLFLACLARHSDAVMELLEYEETDVQKPSCFGASPLEAAVTRGHKALAIVRRLFKRGADLTPALPFLGIPLLVWARLQDKNAFLVPVLEILAAERGITLNGSDWQKPPDYRERDVDCYSAGFTVLCDACNLATKLELACQATSHDHFSICTSCAAARRFCPAEGHNKMVPLGDIVSHGN